MRAIMVVALVTVLLALGCAGALREPPPAVAPAVARVAAPLEPLASVGRQPVYVVLLVEEPRVLLPIDVRGVPGREVVLISIMATAEPAARLLDELAGYYQGTTVLLSDLRSGD